MQSTGTPPHPSVRRLPWNGVRALLTPTLVYLGIVAGGVTAFLALAPVFGYRAFGDRPGPGSFGRVPAIGWGDLAASAGNAVSTGAFLVVVFALPGVLLAALAASSRRPAAERRVLGGMAGLLLTGWWMAGAGGYAAAGWPLPALGALLGAIAGAWALPAPLPPRTRRVLAAIPLLLLCAIPVEAVRGMGPRHSFAVYVRGDASHAQDAEVWTLAMGHPDHPRAVQSGGRDAYVNGSAVLVFTFRPRTPEHVRAAVRARVRASGLADSVVVLPALP